MKNVQRKIVQVPQRSLLAQLRSRLILFVSLLAFFLIASTVAGVYVSINQQQLGEQKVTLHDDVNGLLQSLLDQETGLRGYINTNNQDFLQPFNSGQVTYTSYLENLKAFTNNDNFLSTANALTQVEEAADNWTNTYVNPQLGNMRNGNITQARSNQVFTQGKALFDTIRSKVTNLQQAGNNDLNALQSTNTRFNYILLGTMLIIASFILFWTWRTFSRFTQAQRQHLESLKEAAADFGEGNLAVRVQEGADIDFNEVGHTFNVMAATLQEQQRVLKDRDILEFISQLNTVLTASLDLAALMQNFFQQAFKLLDLQVGALYLFQPTQQTLKLFSAKGIPEADLQKTFTLGEGFVGRVAQEREAFMLSHHDHKDVSFQVQTLIGAVLPSSIYYLPISHGNELLGILAIGSIYPMSEQTRNALNVINTNLASAIHNAQAYEQIQQQALELEERSRQQEESNQALRQQRDELTVLNSALEEANRVRSQFLSTMSHELRTPLTSIIGFAQMLLRSAKKTTLNERQLSNVDRILKNAHHLLTLINDVLDLAKIEAGHMDIHTSEVQLNELLHSVIDETHAITVDRGIKLALDIDEEITTLETDARKVRQIMLNLISNAIKFTEKGSVTVIARKRVSILSEDRQIDQIVLSVKDTGIGIPLEKQKHIFDAFYQVDNGNSRNYGGTGLGLSIVRELTALLGGNVEFESQPGEGSVFTVVLPTQLHNRRFMQNLRLNTIHDAGKATFLSQSSSTHTTELAAYDNDNNAYLIVAIDDNPDVLQLISASLEQTPYRVVGIQDPTQAIAAIQELHPSAITLDIMMPKINGWQILHELKSNPATANIPVILLTVLEDRSAGYVLGADEYLVKPVARDSLLNVLHHLINQQPQTTITAETFGQINLATLPIEWTSKTTQATLLEHIADNAVQNTKLERLKPIILIHNEADIYALLERLIKDKEYTIETTAEGQDVLRVVEEARPDLLMMLIRVKEKNDT
jgi:two-component system, chemotaxis family, sensor kinase CheA